MAHRLVATLLDSASTREQLNHLVWSLQPEQIPLLAQALDELPPFEGLEAVRRLHATDLPHYQDVMSALLTVENPLLGDAAVHFLTERGTEATHALVTALPQAKPLVQLRILAALEQIKDARAVQPLLACLECAATSTLQYMIIRVLGALGDRSVVETIKPYLNDEDHHVREHAQHALERLLDDSRSYN